MPLAPSQDVQAVPNVTPMIDVMLVLLVIFMVAAPAMLSGIPAIPPAAMFASDRPEQRADQVLGDANERFYLDKHRIEKDLLPVALSSIFSARGTDRVLYLRADRSVDYGIVLEAMDIAAKNGVAVVGMISEQQPAAQRHRRQTSQPESNP